MEPHEKDRPFGLYIKPNMEKPIPKTNPSSFGQLPSSESMFKSSQIIAKILQALHYECGPN